MNNNSGIGCCALSEQYIPTQYINRAKEAMKIRSIKIEPTAAAAASKIALAELVQIIFFITLATLFTLSFVGYIPPLIAGIVALSLTPIGAICAYNTFVYFKPIARSFLTIVAVLTVSAVAGLTIYSGTVSDSALTLFGGGVLLNSFRNISEWLDMRNLEDDDNYKNRVLGKGVPEK